MPSKSAEVHPLVGVRLPLPAPPQLPRPTRVPATLDLVKTKRLISPRKWSCDALVTGRGRTQANWNGEPGLLLWGYLRCGLACSITKKGKGARRRSRIPWLYSAAIGLDSARAPLSLGRGLDGCLCSLPRFSRTLEGYGGNQEFHLACAPACHWNACEPNPALGSLSQAARYDRPAANWLICFACTPA